MSVVETEGSLARPAVYGIAVRAIGLALGLATAMFLARHLAAEDLGNYQSVLAICIVLAGQSSALVERPASRRIAASDRGDRSALSQEVASAHLVAGTVVLATSLLLVASSLLPGVPDSTRAVLRVVGLVVPALAVQSLRQWIALPLQGVAASLGPEQLGQPLVFLGVAGLAASLGWLGPMEALVIYAFACWFVWLVSSWRSGLLVHLVEGVRRLPAVRSHRARMREGRPFVVLAAVGVLPVYATVPLVAALLGSADAGRTAIAVQLSGLVGVPLQMVSLAMMPRCARLHRDRNTAALDGLVRRACTISLVFGLVLAALLLVSLDTILRLLGPSFAAASGLVVVLVLGQLLSAALGPNGPTLQMIGLERQAVRIESLATVLRLVAVAVAAALGSTLGVAFAITVTVMLRNLLLSATLYRRAGILTLPVLSRGHVAG